MEAARHLVVLPDPQTGELVEVSQESLEARVRELEDEKREDQRTIKRQARELGALLRDRQAEAQEDKWWPIAVRLFAYHQKVCNHPDSEWKLERFQMVLPYLRGRKYGLEKCLRAITGAQFDAWTQKRANGTLYRHDSWDDIFGGKPKAFEEFVAKAPLDWKPPKGAVELLSK